MSGGSSSSGDSGVSGDPVDAMQKEGYSNADVDAWLSSQAGKDYAGQGQQLKTAKFLGGKYYSGQEVIFGQPIPTGDITDTAKAFLAWKASQKANIQSYNAYQNAALSQPGRDQNILVGPAAGSNNLPYLGGR